VIILPHELKSKEEFLEKLKYAQKVIVVNRLPKYAKLKIRTKRRLYTLKLYNEDEMKELLKRVNVEIVEY